MDKVNSAIETAFAQRPIAGSPEKAVLWDLFELDPYNGGWENSFGRGDVLSRLDAKTLSKLRDWLDENKDRALERYEPVRWASLRADVGLGAWLKQLPPGMYLGPDKDDGLPIQAAAIRTDGKKWDLNIPIRAELLRRLPRFFSERNMADLLGMRKTTYRDLRRRMNRLRFTLDKFTAEDLWAAVRGELRGRKPQGETDKDR